MAENYTIKSEDTNQIDPIELYSQRAISIATYFGGPLAAGILARQNFINLGKAQQGKYALIIGIITTILLFVAIFSVPEYIIDKIPNAIIPFVYIGIIYLVIEKYQGIDLKNHKENNGPFYSAWKATGIGALSMLFLLAGIFGYVYFSPEDFDATKYDSGIATFNKNEEKALQLFSILENSSSDKVISHIDNIGLPSWQENLTLLDELDEIEGLYDQFKKQNEKLRHYTKLRIETFQLLKKAISEKSNSYDMQIQALNTEIDKTLKEL